MNDLYDVWEPAESWDDLPELPDLSEFEDCDEEIDVGYDCFLGRAFVYGPYALIYDEERFRRDLWGWSAQICYLDGRRVCYQMAAHKCGSAEEAYRALEDYLES